MTRLDRSAGIGLAVVALAGLAWASQAPMTAHDPGRAVLRLAWSALPERLEECRQRSDEELARLPQHMRQPVVCEGTSASYRLQVRIDGALVTDRVVHGGGLRRDRRLYVLEELAVAPGEAAVDVRFDRIESGRTGIAAGPPARDAAADETASPPARRGEHVPPRLSLEQRLRFSSGQAILVTYAGENRALVAVHDVRYAR